MRIDESTREVTAYVKIGKGQGGGSYFLWDLASEPSPDNPCLKVTIRIPDGFWAALEPPVIETAARAESIVKPEYSETSIR